jgi:hypothetical protein
MAEPTEMKPKDAPQNNPSGLIDLKCPCCGVLYNPYIRLYELPKPMVGMHLVVFGCAVCGQAINTQMVPTAVLSPSGIITDLSSIRRPS